jgi:hypothetical protein
MGMGMGMGVGMDETGGIRVLWNDRLNMIIISVFTYGRRVLGSFDN